MICTGQWESADSVSSPSGKTACGPAAETGRACSNVWIRADGQPPETKGISFGIGKVPLPGVSVGMAGAKQAASVIKHSLFGSIDTMHEAGFSDQTGAELMESVKQEDMNWGGRTFCNLVGF